MLYPLTFDSIYKAKIWGGQKIRTVLGKDVGELPNCGETWEVSDVEGNVSVVTEGGLKGESLRDLVQRYKGELVGEHVYARHGSEFPLLIKFIDANDDLSIQVHPNDELAKQRGVGNGKTEMWYIMQADEGAQLNAGFQPGTDQRRIPAGRGRRDHSGSAEHGRGPRGRRLFSCPPVGCTTSGKGYCWPKSSKRPTPRTGFTTSTGLTRPPAKNATSTPTSPLTPSTTTTTTTTKRPTPALRTQPLTP